MVSPPLDVVEEERRARLDLDELVDDATAVTACAVTPGYWRIALDGLWVFVAAGHAAAAEAAGWTKDELFSVPPTWSRDDLRGVGLSIGDNEVVEITPTKIGVRTASGAPQGFYRKPAFDVALAYSARLKSLGLDAAKEEPRLRAREAVVLSYQAHCHCSLEEAKRAVLQAIAEAREKV